MVKSFPRLSQAVVDQFIGRKKALSLSVVVKVDKLEVFPIPQGIEHVDYVPIILGVEREDIEQNPALAEKIIPAVIEFWYGEQLNLIVKSVFTGFSGLEIGFGVRHERVDLESAHARVLQFVEEGDFEKAPDFQHHIQYRYAKK